MSKPANIVAASAPEATPRLRHRRLPSMSADRRARFTYLVVAMASPGFEPRVLELSDATRVHIRPIVPEDEPLLIDAVAAMSERSVYFRFFSPLKRLPDALAHRLAVVDYNDRFALVATTHKNSERIVGVARYDRLVGTDVAETPGRGRRLVTTTGIAVGLAIWVSATAVGLSALLRASGELLLALKLVGAAYLAYLGVRTLLESRRRPADLLANAPPTAPAHAIFRQGFLSAISNPKLGVFFVTFLPQFVAPGQALLPRLLELGLIFAVIGWMWMNVYGLFVNRIREIITAPRVRQWMQRVTGVVLLGFGARLALDRV